MTFVWPLALARAARDPRPRVALRRSRAAGAGGRRAGSPTPRSSRISSRRRRAGAATCAPVLALAALALLVVGIARPHVVRNVTRDDATIVLAIDTSRSMAADDVEPTRFQAAKQAALAFLDKVPDNYSVGIVSFSTSADPVLPPTTDREAAKTALDQLRLGSGTAIGNAITRSVDLALDQRPGQRPRPRPGPGERSPAAVLLLSDGAQTGRRHPPAPGGGARPAARRAGLDGRARHGRRRRRGAAAGRAQGARRRRAGRPDAPPRRAHDGRDRSPRRPTPKASSPCTASSARGSPATANGSR